MKTFWKAAPWIGKVIVLLSVAIYTVISIQPLAHPVVSAAQQGIAFTSSAGPTFFRVAFAGFPLGCAAFLAYCLFSRRMTLAGLIFSALLLGIILAVRVYGMEVDASVQQSMPLVIPEIILEAITLGGIAIELRHRSYARRTVASA